MDAEPLGVVPKAQRRREPPLPLVGPVEGLVHPCEVGGEVLHRGVLPPLDAPACPARERDDGDGRRLRRPCARPRDRVQEARRPATQAQQARIGESGRARADGPRRSVNIAATASSTPTVSSGRIPRPAHDGVGHFTVEAGISPGRGYVTARRCTSNGSHPCLSRRTGAVPRPGRRAWRRATLP